MSTKATDRRAKIEAAAPKSRGGANKIVVATVVAVLAIAAIVIGVIVADQGKKADLAAGGSALPKNAAAMGAGLVANRPRRPARPRSTSGSTSSARPVPPSRRPSATSWWA